MEKQVQLAGVGGLIQGKFTKAMTGWFCDELAGLKWDHELFGKQVTRTTPEEAAEELWERLEGIGNLSSELEFGGGGQLWGSRQRDFAKHPGCIRD